LYGELFFALAAWVDAPAWSIATTNSARVAPAAPAAQNRLLRIMGGPFILIQLNTSYRRWGNVDSPQPIVQVPQGPTPTSYSYVLARFIWQRI
jgi:hypothetical protein